MKRILLGVDFAWGWCPLVSLIADEVYFPDAMMAVGHLAG
jgi:hypothetical protein